MPFRVQRKRTSSEAAKERAPVSLGPTDYPVLLEAAGILKTREVYAPLRGAQTAQNPYSAASAVLSYVQMGRFLKIISSVGIKSASSGLVLYRCNLVFLQDSSMVLCQFFDAITKP
jgi:hypothetical protein